MKLITDDQMRQLLENGKATAAAQTQGRKEPEHWPVVKLFMPDGGATWLLSEIDPDEPDNAFGLCDLGYCSAELGSVSFSEISEACGALHLSIERDLGFRARHPLIVYARAAWQAGRIVEDPATLDAVAFAGAGS